MVKDALRGIGSGKMVQTAIESLPLCLQGFSNAAHLLSQLGCLLVVGAEMFNFAHKSGVVLLSNGIVNGGGIKEFVNKEQFVARKEGSTALDISMSMEGARVDGAIMTISC